MAVDGNLDAVLRGKRVLAFGEVLVRLSPPGHLRLRQAAELEVHVGGAELNTAAALACLGIEASLLAALPRNDLGRLAAAAMRKAGVGDELVLWRREGKMGLYFYEAGSHPRSGTVIYDRVGSAASLLSPGEVDWDAALAGRSHFHTTGIAAAISEGSRSLVLEGLQKARAAGVSTSFDLNYRGLFWKREKAREALQPILEGADHLVLSHKDCELVLGLAYGDSEELARAVQRRYGCRSLALTRREDITVNRTRWEAAIWDGQAMHRDRPWELESVDRIGSGDAFAAGYICGILAGDHGIGLRLGNAMAALKHTVPGDMLVCSPEEIWEAARGESGSVSIKR